MRFTNLYALWLLLPVAVVFFVQIRSGRKRAKALERFVKDETLIPPDRGRTAFRMIMCYTALLFCIVALLRPQGESFREMLRGEGLDILIALDTSRSMLADDARPTRLAAAKAAIEQLTNTLRGDRIGLLLFAGSSFLACPLTTDYSAFTEVLREVDTQTIPRGGTSLAAALEGAIKGFKGVKGKSRILVIVSDGEEHEGNTQKILQAVRTAGITVFTAGVGSAQGALIALSGSGQGYLKDREGHVIKSALYAAALRGIAEASGGTMVMIEGPPTLSRLYEEQLAALPKREHRTDMRQQYREWFQIPLGMACILLFLDLLVVVRGRNR